jgi:cobalt/nickel transport protein
VVFFALKTFSPGGLMKQTRRVALAVIFTLMTSGTTLAHFGMLIPSDNMVMQADDRIVTLQLSFSHPMEMIGMELAKPKEFGVFINDKRKNLLDSLTQTNIMGHMAWKSNVKIKRPGIHSFYMEPQPYWEPAEDCFIIHYTKTVVAAFGDDEKWDQEIGLKTEIVPLSKPFGLYAGNIFQGIVKLNGKAVPFSKVEVEYYNKDQKTTAPSDYMITQTVKADANGLFTYAVPKSGWWGFAALNRADFRLKNNGQDKDVELGAVLWVHFEAWMEP